MQRLLAVLSTIFILSLFSCEEVINVDLNFSDPAFVVEAHIYRDSVCNVSLTRTSSYFSLEEPEFIDNAVIIIKDGLIEEELTYFGNGYYSGNTIIGTEGRTYEIEILHEGITYRAISSMPQRQQLISVTYGKSNTQSVLNPYGETVFSINCKFHDDPETDNYYMIRFLEDGNLIERNYFMLTDYNSVGGSFENADGTISFWESIFYDGGEVDVELYCIDKPVYDYFLQLNDVLFWKRRYMPPTPYNPVSNVSNGALGYFAAWTYDSELIILE